MDKRTILLVDINSMFASCHQSVNPSLRNKPVIVGGSMTDKRKGMVIACSYEAKAKGVYTTQTVYEARKLCPDAIFVSRDHNLYNEFSAKIMDFLRLVGPTEVASIDEAYVDVTDRVQDGLHPIKIARYIQKTLWEKIHIPCSIGIGPTTIIAKQASEVKKPMGIVQMGTRQYQTYFHPRPLTDLYGCGSATAEKLNKQGIHTIGELAKADLSMLRVLLGKRGELLHAYALGISRNTVDTMREHIDKSIGRETTFREDISDPGVVFEVAKQMSERLAVRLQQKGNRVRTVSIVYKTERTGRSHTKSITLPAPTSDPEQIYRIAIQLYQDHLYEVPIRLFGVRLANIEEISFDQLTFEDFDFT